MAHERTTFFTIDRKLLESELWLADTFGKGQAWVDLIGLANYKDLKRYEGSEVQVYKRGTVVTSVSTLAERWRWSRHRVSDFLNLLESDTMLTQKRTPRGIVLTIENYDFYQRRLKTEGQLKDSSGTTEGQLKDSSGTQKNKDNNVNNDNKERDTRKARGPYGRVTLSDGDLAKFLGDYPADGQRYIEELDAVMERDGKSYRNCLPALYKWAKREAEYKARHPEEPEPEGGFTFSWAKFGKEEANT